MKALPFPAFQVRRACGECPAWLVRPVLVTELQRATGAAKIVVDMGSRRKVETWCPFGELRTQARAAGDLLAEHLTALPAPDEKSAVPSMAGAGAGEKL